MLYGKQRVKFRFNSLEEELKRLLSSYIFEDTEKDRVKLEEEITKLAKVKNIFSHYGGKYKTVLEIDLENKTIRIDIRTIKDNWRLIKYDFLIADNNII